MKGKCKYCGAPIDPTCYRCYKCDVAWQEGRDAGIQEMKSKLREIFTCFLNILKDPNEKKD